ncbi:MAG: hypothetical protein ACP5LZ_03480 [Fervidicoccaceae archaeon]
MRWGFPASQSDLDPPSLVAEVPLEGTFSLCSVRKRGYGGSASI